MLVTAFHHLEDAVHVIGPALDEVAAWTVRSLPGDESIQHRAAVIERVLEEQRLDRLDPLGERIQVWMLGLLELLTQWPLKRWTQGELNEVTLEGGCEVYEASLSGSEGRQRGHGP